MAQYHVDLQFKNVGYALAEYERDNHDTLPPLKDTAALEALLLPYCIDHSGDSDNYVQLHPMLVRPGTNIRYLFNASLSNRKINTIINPTEIVVMYEERPVDGQRLIGYVDAHCRSVTEAEWREIKKKSGIK